MEYNLKLAKAVKEKYPDCVIVFGGHNVPDDISLLEKYDFIDVLMHAEGEEPFALLLKKLIGDKDFSSIPDIFPMFKSVISHQRKSQNCNVWLCIGSICVIYYKFFLGRL